MWRRHWWFRISFFLLCEVLLKRVSWYTTWSNVCGHHNISLFCCSSLCSHGCIQPKSAPIGPYMCSKAWLTDSYPSSQRCWIGLMSQLCVGQSSSLLQTGKTIVTWSWLCAQGDCCNRRGTNHHRPKIHWTIHTFGHILYQIWVVFWCPLVDAEYIFALISQMNMPIRSELCSFIHISIVPITTFTHNQSINGSWKGTAIL